ncbi:MAG: (Fe-S)-binding protein [Thermodesulfobacteriota bacterium]
MDPLALNFWEAQQIYIAKIFLPILIGFAVLSVGLIALFIFSFKRQHYRLWHLGKPEDCSGQWATRLRTLFAVALGHQRIWRTAESYPGTMHLLIFWGILLIFVGKAIRLFSYPVGLTTPPQPLFLHASFLSEIGGGMALGGGFLAFFRRFLLRPSRLEIGPDHHVIFILGFVILVTGYLAKAYRMVAAGTAIPSDWFSWAPISSLLSPFILIFRSEAQNEILVWHRVLMHAIPSFFLLLYVAISRSALKHLFLSPLNVFFRSLKPKGALHPIPDFDEAETFGVKKISEFTWKQLLDLEACTRCGRCQDHCPAHLTEKPLSPKKVILDLRAHLHEKGKPLLWSQPLKEEEGPPLPGGLITEDALWACTFCLNCYEQCPVMISAFDKIIEMRRYLVLMETRYPSELREVFRNMERRSNPWGAEKRLRAEWAKALGVKTLAEDPKVDFLYFPGCFKGFDDRNQRVAIAMVKILRRAGVKFGILGPEEGCCGDPARRIGNEYLYKILAEANIETMNRYQVKKILTTCPHCFTNLKNEYPQFGGNFEVIHQTEFLYDLVKHQKLKLKGIDPITVTYHDSCYLGRYNQIYETPRMILSSIPGVKLKEMERSRSQSFCCGGGGGRMWMEEHIGKRINEVRIEQALELKPDVIATACPYCLTMLGDGLKTKGMEEKVKSLDIAELLEKSLGE